MNLGLWRMHIPNCIFWNSTHILPWEATLTHNLVLKTCIFSWFWGSKHNFTTHRKQRLLVFFLVSGKSDVFLRDILLPWKDFVRFVSCNVFMSQSNGFICLPEKNMIKEQVNDLGLCRCAPDEKWQITVIYGDPRALQKYIPGGDSYGGTTHWLSLF